MDEILMKLAGAGISYGILIWIILDQKATIKELKQTVLDKDLEIKGLNDLIRDIQKESITVAMKITEVVENLIEYLKDKLK